MYLNALTAEVKQCNYATCYVILIPLLKKMFG